MSDWISHGSVGHLTINQAMPVIHQEWKEFVMSLQSLPLQKRKATLDQWISRLKLNQDMDSQEWEFYCLLVRFVESVSSVSVSQIILTLESLLHCIFQSSSAIA